MDKVHCAVAPTYLPGLLPGASLSCIISFHLCLTSSCLPTGPNDTGKLLWALK